MKGMAEIRQILLELGEQKGMCRENLMALGRCREKESALNLYFRTIDWALENDYPGYAFILEHFTDMESSGLFVNRSMESEEIRNQVAVFHHCSGTIKAGLDVENAVIPMIYLASGTSLTIEGNGYDVVVPVYVCEGCRVVEGKDSRLKIFHI